MRSMRGLKELVLEEGIIQIGRDCFRDCKQLTSIVIPSTVIEFGRGCFVGTGLQREEYQHIPDYCF